MRNVSVASVYLDSKSKGNYSKMSWPVFDRRLLVGVPRLLLNARTRSHAHIHIYIYTHAHIHIYIYTYIYIYIMKVGIYTNHAVQTLVRERYAKSIAEAAFHMKLHVSKMYQERNTKSALIIMHVYININIYIYTQIYIYTSLYAYIYIYIYIHMPAAPPAAPTVRGRRHGHLHHLRVLALASVAQCLVKQYPQF